MAHDLYDFEARQILASILGALNKCSDFAEFKDFVKRSLDRKIKMGLNVAPLEDYDVLK